jgi:phosphoglycerate dehydrogenase-like enzyme
LEFIVGCAPRTTPQVNQEKKQAIAQEANSTKRSETMMQKGEKLVIVGCSGAGGPAAMMAKKLMPEVAVTVIRKEPGFIVR